MQATAASTLPVLAAPKPEPFSVILVRNVSGLSSPYLESLNSVIIGKNKLFDSQFLAGNVRIIDASIHFHVSSVLAQTNDSSVVWCMYRSNHPLQPFPSGADALTQYNSGSAVLSLAGQQASPAVFPLQFGVDGIADNLSPNQTGNFGPPLFRVFFDSSAGAAVGATQMPAFTAIVRGHFVIESPQ